ncbi:MAG: hypothetical protein INH02_06725 [Gemmatimonas sp.]|uniref:hypothetical protein n=1 Tax=Gemmatimonas sp. TaxID=1962908 RepID=UPI0025BB2E28|nr:hypothetical protein [Gemmatimonas sp.]MCA2987097.1 hypothetical protein [Gemmatimonas sp.]
MRVVGTGAPLVLISGFTTSGDVWDEAVAAQRAGLQRQPSRTSDPAYYLMSSRAPSNTPMFASSCDGVSRMC